MMRTLALILLVAASALPARAQPPPSDDIIGSLLDPRHHPTREEEEEPDTAGQPHSATEPDPRLSPTTPPPPASPAPQSEPAAPVDLNDTARTPDRPPGERALAYDARIRAAFASAQGFQGPLDGGWTLSDARGGGRYALQIVDRRDRLEAVWRDLRRPGSLNASGLVDDIRRAGAELTLRIADSAAPASVITLHEGADGVWIGRLVRGDEAVDVSLRRTGP